MIIHYSSVAHPDDYSDRIKEVISTPGYSKTVRAVTTATRREVFREYGITNAGPGDYEIDHLIPLSLGGSNSIKNLWPESYQTVLNAHVKDRLEDRLDALVVQGKIGLKTKFALHKILFSRRTAFRAALQRMEAHPKVATTWQQKIS